MSLVVDASVVVSACIDAGSEGRWAEAQLLRYPLYAPELLMVETANILRRLEASKRIAAEIVGAAYQDLHSLDLQLAPFAPFAGRVWSLRHGVTCYDAWYVALAESVDAPLATLDGRLVRSTGPRCEFLQPPAG